MCKIKSTKEKKFFVRRAKDKINKNKDVNHYFTNYYIMHAVSYY